jgi:hypothetical protein
MHAMQSLNRVAHSLSLDRESGTVANNDSQVPDSALSISGTIQQNQPDASDAQQMLGSGIISDPKNMPESTDGPQFNYSSITTERYLV